MRYIDEYRAPELAKKLCQAIHAVTTQPWTIMEICGGQTHAILKFGIDQLLPKEINLVHGPGCPVCVTPLELVDRSIAIASSENTILCTFGDMMRVPGSSTDLLKVKAQGGDVRMVYSPLDAVNIARKNPDSKVVFFGVGFETTAPANAMAVFEAARCGIENFSMLVSQVLVPPAMEAILSSPQNLVQGFLAAGHVCTVMGYEEYYPIAAKYQVPIVITGFEPLDLLQGILRCIKQLETGLVEVENPYSRVVRKEGNLPARKIMDTIFKIVDRKWRGIGTIPRSGLALREEFQHFDAIKRFGLEKMVREEPSECISGLILQGLKKPYECPAFETPCNPENPLGATMVSSEGACAAYYKYRAGR